MIVNSSRGKVDLLVRPDFDLRAFVASVGRFGYRFGLPVERPRPASSELVWRLAVCSAIAMNSMIFGIALYAGLDRGPLFRLFSSLNFGLGTLAVWIGGSVFIRSAFRALESRILHLDLPIATGIVLAFVGSVYSYFATRSQTAYFDTLDIFITLMLFGRWLQERVIERSRAWLLTSEGPDALLARRVRSGLAEIVPSGHLRAGDVLLVAPGEIVSVDAVLEDHPASFSLDWISGESQPVSFAMGDTIPAGAISVGPQTVRMAAETDFSASPLGDLVRMPEARFQVARVAPFRRRLSLAYVLAVLTTAGVNLIGWFLMTHDLVRALGTTTAVLVVTCPCAIGIAVPLAYEMVQAGLLRRGLFVRRADFLDRARDVTSVIFDKTGTLTSGTLALANPDILDELAPDALDALYQFTARSAHPKAAAIRQALRRLRAPTVDWSTTAVDFPGLGVELQRAGRIWRFGDPRWVGGTFDVNSAPDVGLSVDGQWIAGFHTIEELRTDAAREIMELQRDGYAVWLLSGDKTDRVEAVASELGIRHALGDQSPAAKANFLAQQPPCSTLFVGDGVNDAPALDRAHVSGTPAVDRPFVPARVDFFYVTPGLAPVRLALRCSRALANVIRADLAFAAIYNLFALALAVSGRISPLVCSILMPSSSLATTLMTAALLSPRNRLWRS